MGFVFWIVCCIGVGIFASSKGRSGVGWFFLSAFISPLIGGIIIACMKDLKLEADVKHVEMSHQQLRERVASDERLYEHRIGRVERDVSRIQDNVAVNQQALNYAYNRTALGDDQKLCPHCGEAIKLEAIKCRFCGEMIENTVKKQCPYCKEMIREEAIVCKYCRSNLLQQLVPLPEKIDQHESLDEKTAVFESRSGMGIECPICHKAQKSNRDYCYNCGIKFLYSDEQVVNNDRLARN